MANGSHEKNLAQVGDLVHVEKFFARNLEVSSVSGQASRAGS